MGITSRSVTNRIKSVIPQAGASSGNNIVRDATNAHFFNKKYMGQAILKKGYHFVIGDAVVLEDIHPERFAAAKFRFIDDDGIKRQFRGIDLLRAYDLKLTCNDIENLMRTLEIKIRDMEGNDTSNIMEIRGAYIKAMIELRLRPDDPRLLQCIRHPLKSFNGENIENVLMRYDYMNGLSFWSDALKKIVFDLKITDQEMDQIEAYIGKKMNKASIS
jgi:hypothetical protein